MNALGSRFRLPARWMLVDSLCCVEYVTGIASSPRTYKKPQLHCSGTAIIIIHPFSNVSNIIFAAAALILANWIRAAPVTNKSSPNLSPPLVANVPFTSTCSNGVTCRTLWNIVWSGVNTIFLCIWVSFHPDVASTGFTEARVTAVRILSVFFAFLVPEFIVIRAGMQWLEARRHQSSFAGILSTRSPS